jgi:hypothetical protein
MCAYTGLKRRHHSPIHSLIDKPLLPGNQRLIHTSEQIQGIWVVGMWIVALGLLDCLAMAVYTYKTHFSRDSVVRSTINMPLRASTELKRSLFGA